MERRVISVVSHILVIFLLINYNYAEETRITSSKGDSHIRRSRDLKHIKSLKIRLEWFDKTTDALIGGEYSGDLRDDGTVIEELGLSIANNVNNGGYDVQPSWVAILQKHFKHRINLAAFDYQVAFDYREWWEDMRVISFELFKSPSWRKANGNIYVNLTPDVSGEIVRAVYTYIGHNDPSTMVRIHLLGTSFDCKLNHFADTEFFPTQKKLIKGQPFEVSHSQRATKTRHDKFEMGRPLQVKLTLTVRVQT